MEVVEGLATVDDIDNVLDQVSEIGADTGSTVQVFDARYIVGRRHLERAVTLAERERARGEAIARDPAVEILLYAAGRRQITRALEIGLSPGTSPVVAIAVGGEERAAARRLATLFDPAETLGQYDESRVCEFFEISSRERKATDGTIADIVHERVALLVVER